MKKCPKCGKKWIISHGCTPDFGELCEECFVGDPEVTHPDNPVYARLGPKCNECFGAHEPSGARSDCIKYWRDAAKEALENVEHARTLLCSATPSKVLSESQSVEWCQGFGKWFADSWVLTSGFREYSGIGVGPSPRRCRCGVILTGPAEICDECGRAEMAK